MAQRLDDIEKHLKDAGIPEYEIMLVREVTHEHQYRKLAVEIEREVATWHYFLRVLEQKAGGTGIGVIKGSAFNAGYVSDLVARAENLAKHNEGAKYEFVEPRGSRVIPVADHDPEREVRSALVDLSEQLVSAASDCPAIATFGKLRRLTTRTWLRNSSGLDGEKTSGAWYLEFALKAQDGPQKAEYWSNLTCKCSQDLNVEQRLHDWSQYAIDTLHATVPTSVPELEVIFPPKVIREAFMPVVGYHAAGEALHEGTSKFSQGVQVAHEQVTLDDDGLFEAGTRSGPWDGEGTSQRTTRVIDAGTFVQPLLDRRFGRLLDEPSTGNGIRAENGTIANAPTNFVLAPGTFSFAELVETTRHGLYVLEFSWLNPDELTGSFGAEIRNAYEIVDGQLGQAIKGGSLSGNVLDMLHDATGFTREVETRENAALPWGRFKNLKLAI